jgi:ParB family chromosome partitioning protein
MEQLDQIPHDKIRFVFKDAVQLAVAQVRPFDGQPRQFFDKEALRQLSGSLMAVGQVKPIIVIRVYDDIRYTHELVDGERRWRSAKDAKQESILAMEIEIKTSGDVSPKDAQFIIGAISNFGHQEHEPLEVAKALDRTKNALKVSNEILAQMYSRSSQWVSNHLNLLKLTPSVQALMDPYIPEARRLKPACASLLIGLAEETQLDLAMKTVSNGWSRIQLHQTIRQLQRGGHIGKAETRPRRPNDDFRLVESAILALDERLVTISEIPISNLKGTVRARGPAAKAALIATLTRCIESLGNLREQVRQIELNANLHIAG